MRDVNINRLVAALKIRFGNMLGPNLKITAVQFAPITWNAPQLAGLANLSGPTFLIVAQFA